MVDNNIIRIRDTLVSKRQAQIKCSGYQSMTNSNHMCAILNTSGVPISYGTNIFNVGSSLTEHAEAQALRKLCERMGRPSKKIKIDLIVVRTNYSNSKPCNRCINRMIELSDRFNIRNIYYTDKKEPDSLRCVKFSKLANEDRHFCSYDRNKVRNTFVDSYNPQFCC
jgi:cytidine deaminase